MIGIELIKTLRTYTHTAQTCHFCDYCYHDIYPGDEYRATVYAARRPEPVRVTSSSNGNALSKLSNGRVIRFIMTKKEHVCCPFDPFEEEEEMRKKAEEDRAERAAAKRSAA